MLSCIIIPLRHYISIPDLVCCIDNHKLIGNIETNLKLVEAANIIAKKKGCSVGQLSLAWVHAQGVDVIPIPGTSSISHLEANFAAKNITLTKEEIIELEEIFNSDKIAGNRYEHMAMTYHGQIDNNLKH